MELIKDLTKFINILKAEIGDENNYIPALGPEDWDAGWICSTTLIVDALEAILDKHKE